MILFINTSKIDLIQVKLINGGKVIGALESREEYKQSELLLVMIDKLAKKLKIKFKSLKAIAVVSGPGAFSALRFGITTANTLAWSLNIPVVEISVDEAENEIELIKILENKLSQAPIVFKPIVPKYGKEPNIIQK